MTIPGELGNNVTNKFSGPLLGTLGSQNNFNGVVLPAPSNY